MEKVLEPTGHLRWFKPKPKEFDPIKDVCPSVLEALPILQQEYYDEEEGEYLWLDVEVVTEIDPD